jgi:hypothetical protein
VDENDQPPWKYLAEWSGECVANDDPLRLGRIRVRIPGLIEPASAWVFPKGFGGHHYDVPYTQANYAAMDPPQPDRPGDEVIVTFLGGDPDQLRWEYGHGGMPDGVTPEVPEPVKTMAPEDAPWIKAHDFGNWIIVADDRKATKGIQIIDKTTGENILEYDGAHQSLRLTSVAGLALAAGGALSLQGLTVTIVPSGIERRVEPRPETL